jgi:sugar phosphate permease
MGEHSIPSTPGSPTRVRYFVLTAVCSLAVLTYLQRQAFVAASPFIKSDLGLNDEHMGYLGSVWLVAYGAFQIPTGWLGDLLGARRLLTALVLGWSLTAGAVALIVYLPTSGAQAFVALLFLRFLFGMFQAGGFPGIARVVADWMPVHRRGFAQGLVWTCSRFGGAVAYQLLNGLLVVFGGWMAPLGLMSALGLVWTGLFYPWYRGRPDEMPQVNAAERELITAGRPAVPLATAAVPWSRFLTSANVWALCLMYGFVGFGGNFITVLLPIYLRDHRGLSNSTTALLSSLPLAFGVVSCFFGGALSDWLVSRLGSRTWGRRCVGILVLSLAALSVLSCIWADETWLLALALSAWFFFNDANMAPAWAACADVGEQYAGTLSGAMNMTGNLVGALGIAFAGFCLEHRHYDIMFTVFAFSYLLSAGCWLIVDVARPLAARAR